jgi:hypothetical protein
MADGPFPEREQDALVEELRRVAALVDPVPERVRDAARGSFSWRTIDAELAELAYDSAAQAGREALVRSADTRRLLTFDAAGLSIEVEVTSTDPDVRLVGQVVPPQRAEIEVRHAGGRITVEADDLGRFAADGISAGPVSLVCRLGERTVATAWLVV